MSRLSRRIERNQDRQTLGNRKKRIAREQLMVSEAISFGATLRMMKLLNSVAGLDYGAAYYVPPTVEANATDQAVA
jgi:hypothetical protein